MIKEKARQWGEPIPNAIVCQDTSSDCISVAPINLQVSRLMHRCAVSAAIAATLAPMVWGGAHD